jgi:hypothetical protein
MERDRPPPSERYLSGTTHLNYDGQFCLAGLARFSTTQDQLMPKLIHSNKPGT